MRLSTVSLVPVNAAVSPPCSAPGAAPGLLPEEEGTLWAETGMLCTQTFPEGD